MNKEDMLCKYIEDLVNSIYLGFPIQGEEDTKHYHTLVNGLKAIGFKFDMVNTTRFNDLVFSKQLPVCKECGDELKTKEEKKFGQCDKCCAWKYRENS